MKLRPVAVCKNDDELVHATWGNGTLCGEVEGFDWRLDRMLDETRLGEVNCPDCRYYMARVTVQGHPRRRARTG